MLTPYDLEQKLRAFRAEQRTVLATREEHLLKARECEVQLMHLQGRVLQLEELLGAVREEEGGQEA